MHILFGILTIVTFVSVWAWRLRMAKGVARKGVDMARTAANAPRRLSFKYKAGKGGLALIDDPREAAAIMMMEVARARGGPLTDLQADAIEAECREAFNMNEIQAEELVAHAAWVTNDAPKPQDVMNKLSRTIVSSPQLGPKEIVDLDGMLVAVSEAEGTPTRDQLALLQVFRDKAGLKT